MKSKSGQLTILKPPRNQFKRIDVVVKQTEIQKKALQRFKKANKLKSKQYILEPSKAQKLALKRFKASSGGFDIDMFRNINPIIPPKINYRREYKQSLIPSRSSMIRQSPSMLQRQMVRQAMKSQSLQLQRPTEAQIKKIRSGNILTLADKTTILTGVKSAQTTTQMPMLSIDSMQQLKQSMIQQPAQLQRPSQITGTTTGLLTRYPSLSKPKVIQRYEQLKAMQSQGYDVMIKRTQAKTGKKYKSRGYVKGNRRTLDYQSAEGKLMNILDNYANRSGYIKKSKKPGIRDPSLVSRSKALAYKFRQNKKNPRILTEKSKYAIDSPGELRGITYKGIKATRGNIMAKKRRKGKKGKTSIKSKIRIL